MVKLWLYNGYHGYGYNGYGNHGDKGYNGYITITITNHNGYR